MAENSKSKESPTEESSGAAGGATAATDEDNKPISVEHSAQSTSDWLRDYMVSALKISAEKPEQLLPTVDVEGVANFIKSDKCKNVVTMAGAGISTSAGIPDFRSPGSGLYDNLEKYNLPHPQAIFQIDYFKENPEPFFVLAKELFPGTFKPTPSHYFLRLLAEKDKLMRHYTQNIDTLERVAGLVGDKIVEAHGTFHTSHCLECEKEYTLEHMKEQLFTDKIPPKCTEKECEGIIKPDIVFFGEKLPDRFAECVTQDFQKCDLLIILGTSLVVQPFASLIHRVPNTTPRLYINREKGETSAHPLAALFFGGANFDFDSEDNYRDVFLGGDCDDGCYQLADLLGWGDELRKLVKSEHDRIDKINKKELSGTAASGGSKASKLT